MDIHPTAVVATTAQLGEGSVVEPFGTDGRKVRIGERMCPIDHDATVGKPVDQGILDLVVDRQRGVRPPPSEWRPDNIASREGATRQSPDRQTGDEHAAEV